MYQITEKFISLNRSKKSFTPIGIVIHETANPNDSADMEFRYFNSGDRQASAHAFIDSGNIIQTIPWLEVGWHAGKTANSKFIGIEMCHTTNSDKFKMIWDRTVWLFAYLFVNVIKCNTITKDNLMSHAEVSNLWKETDHLDPVDYFATFGKTVDTFRQEVQIMINQMTVPKYPQWQLDCVQYLTDKKFILSEHAPDENLTLQIFSQMMNNVTTKASSIIPIAWLLKNGYITGVHNKGELLTISTFAYIVGNKLKETISESTLDYLLRKGFLTQPRTNKDEIVTMSLFGAMVKNGDMKGVRWY